MQTLANLLQNPLAVPVIIMAVILGLFPLVAGYLVLLERKVLADMQVRLGPMRVGPQGLLQPIADAVKLLIKEDIIPAASDKFLFWIAPCITLICAFVAFSVVPFAQAIHITDVNVGLLVVSAMGSVGILGIILGGWASNSHYSLLGALRSAAQLVSYEVALSVALVSGVMAAGTLSMVEIVQQQQQRGLWLAFDNLGLMLLPFVIYFISSVAETNRAPFDLPEAESELVAGFHTEYSGFRWALYMLAEYANIFVVTSVAVTLFWGGWLRPFPSVGWLAVPLNFGVPLAVFGGLGALCFYLLNRQPSAFQKLLLAAIGAGLVLLGLVFMIPPVNAACIGVFWFLFKVSLLIYAMIWFRGTFPRLRYDQLMNFGWKYLIPIGLVLILVNAVVGMALHG